MHPDDVKAALDALASEQSAPNATAAAVMGRGRHRIVQHRVAFIGVAAALVAVIATVASVSAFRDTVSKVSTVPFINVPPEARGPHPSSRFPSALEGWKCGNPMEYTADGGETWHQVALPADVPPEANLCTAVAGGNAWETWSNAAFTEWHLVRIRHLTDIDTLSLPPVPKDDLNPTLTFIDKDHGWFITRASKSDSHVYGTSDGGASWKLVTDQAPAGRFAFASTARGWSLSGNTLFGTTDGGATWREAASSLPAGRGEVARFELATFGDSIIVSSGTLINESQYRYRTFFDVSTDNAATWSVRAGPKGFELPHVNNIFGATDATHWALTSGAELRITDDGGRTWQARPDIPNQSPNGTLLPPLAFANREVGWVTTEAGKILRTTDSGNTWTDVTNGAQPVTALKPAARLSPPAPTPLASASSNDAWICGNPMTHSTASFDPFESGTRSFAIPTGTRPSAAADAQPHVSAAAPGGNAWLIRGTNDPQRPEIVRVRGGGSDVKVFPFGYVAHPQIESINFIDANNGWALVQLTDVNKQNLYRTHDGGATWALLARNVPVGGEVKFSNADVGWAAGWRLPNLAHTTDGGTTWRDVALPVPHAPLYAPMTPVFADGNVIVVYGKSGTGTTLVPFFDVSTNGGTTWSLRAGPPGVDDVHGAGQDAPPRSGFGAADADHWALGFADHLYLTDDGGRTWTERAQFAGLDTIWYVDRPSASSVVVSGIGDASNQSTVVLASDDAGDTWATVDFWGPGTGPVNFPGGIIGCPTHPLTPAPPGNPPPGLIAAASDYIRTYRHWTPQSYNAVYPFGANPKNSFGYLFKFQVASCGNAAVADSWVVEAQGPTGGASIPRTQLALSHSTDGWHVFGSYH